MCQLRRKPTALAQKRIGPAQPSILFRALEVPKRVITTPWLGSTVNSPVIRMMFTRITASSGTINQAAGVLATRTMPATDAANTAKDRAEHGKTGRG